MLLNLKKISKLKPDLPQISTLIIGLFFLLVLHFKWSYNLLPMLLAVIGLYLLYPTFRAKSCQLQAGDKWIIFAILGYFSLFIISLIAHHGKMNELDLPSRLVIILPILAVCAKLPLKPMWIIISIVCGSFVAGIVAIIQFFWLKLPHIFPIHMYIQSGDIVLSLALFSLISTFYFRAQRRSYWALFSLISCGLGIFACIINQARGAWIALPIMLGFIFYCYRTQFSKGVVIFLILLGVATALVAGNVVQKRWEQASYDIQQYVQKNNGNSSLGARFDMWKSAVLGIEEKPIFGWGLQGVKEMRKQHIQQKLVDKVIATFDHAHNQYLQDSSARGIFGLFALLAIFLVPLRLMWRQLKQNTPNSLAYFWGCCGVVHICATMLYCLSQSFLSHNSGMIFYGMGLLLFYGLQKSAPNSPLVEQA